MSDCYESKDVTVNGKKYRVEFNFDHDLGAPWKESEGHGIVSERESRDKKPGEVIISTGRGRAKRFYDVKATTELAKRDGWGVSGVDISGMTQKQITALSVHKDLERMRGWCNGDWHW